MQPVDRVLPSLVVKARVVYARGKDGPVELEVPVYPNYEHWAEGVKA